MYNDPAHRLPGPRLADKLPRKCGPGSPRAAVGWASAAIDLSILVSSLIMVKSTGTSHLIEK